MPRSYSPRLVEAVMERLRAAVDLEQPVTLSPDEAWLILAAIRRLLHRR